jgi:hypothetical protein
MNNLKIKKMNSSFKVLVCKILDHSIIIHHNNNSHPITIITLILNSETHL